MLLMQLLRDAHPLGMPAVPVDPAQSPLCLPPSLPATGVHGSVGQANYSTAKAGVVGLTKAVAREWGPFGIRCNALVFGYINTRWVEPACRGCVALLGAGLVGVGVAADALVFGCVNTRQAGPALWGTLSRLMVQSGYTEAEGCTLRCAGLVAAERPEYSHPTAFHNQLLTPAALSLPTYPVAGWYSPRGVPALRWTASLWRWAFRR